MSQGINMQKTWVSTENFQRKVRYTIPVAILIQIPSFPIAHVEEHQQPLGILHTFWPAKDPKKHKIKSKLTTKETKKKKKSEIKNTRLTLQPSRRREAASAVPETPTGIFGTSTRLSSTVSLASYELIHLHFNNIFEPRKQQ